MNDFYLTLPSTSNLKRFPDNKANSFKVMLPNPLILDGEWNVGLAAISLPESRKNLKDIFGSDPLFKEGVEGDWTNTQSQTYITTYGVDDIPDYNWSTGVSFMKAMTSKLRNHTTHQDGKYTHYLGGIKFFEKDSKDYITNNYGLFRWDDAIDQLLLDNSHATISDAHFLIKKELAHKMKWIIPPVIEGGVQKEVYKLGPNLICELVRNSKLPDFLTDNLYKDVKEYPPTRNGFMFCESVPGYYKLSRNANWRFVNINAAYDAMTRGEATTLYMYSDVCKKSVVGNQLTDFLREVPYFSSGAGQHYFEPKIIRHIPVQRNYIESVEIQISSDHSAKLAELGDGASTVVLHFLQK